MLGFVGKTICSNNSAVVQSLIRVWLFVTPYTAALQASLFFTNSWVCSDSCTMSWGCYLTISSSVAPFSFCPQSFPASGSFPMSWPHIRWPKYWSFSFISASSECSGLISFTGLISLQSKGLSSVFSSTTIQRHQFFGPQPSLLSKSASTHDYWKNHNFDYTDLCWQCDVSAF